MVSGEPIEGFSLQLPLGSTEGESQWMSGLEIGENGARGGGEFGQCPWNTMEHLGQDLPMNFPVREIAQLKTIVLNMGFPGQNSAGL